MSASQHHILFKQIEIYDVCVLIGMVFRLELKTFLILAILVLKQITVGVSTVEKVVKSLDFVESRCVSISESLRVGILDRLGDS
jgi:hypothetical protein